MSDPVLPTLFDETLYPYAQEMTWGRIKVHSSSSLEVWETESHEHYLVGYNPQHPHLIDIVSLPQETEII